MAYDQQLADAYRDNDRLTSRVARLENFLAWIRFQAGLHYMGGAFDPEHMRALANLAADALDGTKPDEPNYREVMEQAREHGEELHAALMACTADDPPPAEEPNRG